MIRTVKEKENKQLSKKLTRFSLIYQQVSKKLIRAFPFLPSQGRYNITICHQKKLVWFRVAKVGTRTIFRLFDDADIALDAEHAMWCHYPVHLYRDYFKFAFVRNPWDRLVSCWHSKVLAKNYFKFSDEELAKMQDFAHFVGYVAGLDTNNLDNHLRPQSELIDLNNIDYIGRFENFESDLTEVIDILGLGTTFIPKENASKNRHHYRAYYDEEMKQKVAMLYRKDLRIFAYKF